MSAPDLSKYRDLFFSEADDLLKSFGDQLLALERQPGDPARIAELFRVAHTLKGMAATMGFEGIRDATHRLENALDHLRSGRAQASPAVVTALLTAGDGLAALVAAARRDQPAPPSDAWLAALEAALATKGAAAPASPAPQATPERASGASGTRSSAEGAAPEGAVLEASATMRITVGLLDELLNLVGELVIAKTRLQQLASISRQEPLERAVSMLHRVTTALQEKVLDTRVLPASQLFGRFPRLVRDLSLREGKTVELVLRGEEVGLDSALLEALVEPLTHLITNAVIHGVEPAEERARAGKAPAARVTLAASKERGFVTLEISDDGRGMQADALKRKAVELGFVTETEARTLSDREALILITRPGFSTARQLTSGAGRGVGMDVVRHKVEAIQGTLSIDSVPGQGSRFLLRLPFTLTILQALLVKADDTTYCLPFLSVRELIPSNSHGHDALPYQGEQIPVRPLSNLLGRPSATTPPRGPYALLEAGNRRLALAVDSFLTQQEVVVKPLPPPLTDLKPYGGATILGDGRVALILDVNELLR